MKCDLMNNLHEKLQKRREYGENDLIIKYIKGIPNIIIKNKTQLDLNIYYQNARILITKFLI